jgi:hypothetical protein
MNPYSITKSWTSIDSIEFQAWVGELLDEGFGARPKPSATKHLDDASTTISNNIAEGNGELASVHFGAS